MKKVRYVTIELRNKIESIDEVLNEMSSDGWELCSTACNNYGNFTRLIFKQNINN